MDPIKLALPKGRLMAETAALFEKADWGLKDYREGTRSYRLTCARFPTLQAKIFHEKDIPIQVAVGNYDLGICSLDWVHELTVKYPNSALVKLRDFSYGEGAVYAVAAGNGKSPVIESICSKGDTVRLVSEYPNLAESFALKLRLKRFSVFPVWGAAEVYPPESADLALMPAKEAAVPFNHGLTAVDTVLRFNACLVVNRDRWQNHDLSEVLVALDQAFASVGISSRHIDRLNQLDSGGAVFVPPAQVTESDDTVRLALPDGHQQDPAVKLLTKAGIRLDDYPSSTGNRRPVIEGMPGLSVKVIRPQDMPMQVAAGNFDLAITGIDWLRDHLYQFPSSPVRELVDLKMASVRIVAVVCNELPVSNGHEIRDLWKSRSEPIRIASEYANIGDRYARDNHFGRYRIIPTWGATEAFLPEDADLLIENTETGSTIARHNLKIIDTLFNSTGHLIGNPGLFDDNSRKRAIADTIINALKKAVET
jgi:ATP phosphoribosyltransferase